MKIAVLMSTYNGEKYIKEQIESILSQRLSNNCEFTLFIRDDGSIDHTREIIERYEKHYENVVSISSVCPIHRGIKKSFLLLLKMAAEEGFDFYAFADQDDVWMEDKLAAAVNSLKGSRNQKGALYYSNRCVVDENLHIKEKERIRYYGDFTEILCGTKAAGNTMLFNHKLAKYVLFHPSQVADNHDEWVYRLAKCIGSDIFFDEKVHIYYRQHTDNVAGYSPGSHSDWLYMIKNFAPKLIEPREHYFQNQVREIFRFYREDLDPKIVSTIKLVMDYNKNLKSKWGLLTDSDLRKRPVLDQCIWFYKVLFNMI